MTETETKANQLGGGSINAASGWAYDVFLNFRSVDSRTEFITDLNKALIEKGYQTFFDDEELPRGREIASSLRKAIEESQFAVVVFSPCYADSRYCLDELEHIMKHLNGKEERLVLPVFYNVDPKHVRYQLGAYGEAFDKHRNLKRVDEMTLQNWKQALHDASKNSGWHIQPGSKSKYMTIRKIIGEISRKIKRSFVPMDSYYLVDVDAPARVMIEMLNLDTDEGVSMLGISGLGGSGKTTLARYIFNLISGHFEGTCFLADVERRISEHGLVRVQETLLSEIVEDKDIRFNNVNDIIPTIKQRLCRKKVLLVLADVNTREAIGSLAGGPDWFGPGSRIIITSRAFDHGIIKTLYKNYMLDFKDSLDLFCWWAFEDGTPGENFMPLVHRILVSCRGNPLALEIVGSGLFGKQIYEWKSFVDKYLSIPNFPECGIQDIISLSYDNLDDEVKTIFLDIACCFNDYELEYVKDVMLNGRGIDPNYGIQVLITKSLIKIDGGRVKMHGLVKDLGRHIVYRESPNDPCECSRIWSYEDILQVLGNNKGKNDRIELMKIDLPNKDEVVQLHGDAFRNMTKLTILEIVNTRFSCVPTHLPKSLRVLNCKGYFGGSN